MAAILMIREQYAPLLPSRNARRWIREGNETESRREGWAEEEEKGRGQLWNRDDSCLVGVDVDRPR